MARKKSTKKTSPVVQEYNKERNRIKRQKERMLSRGYVFSGDVLPPIPKKITRASVRRLKKITTKKLYDISDFTVLTDDSLEIVSGKQGRIIERKQSAQKAAQTRARKKREREFQQSVEDYGKEVQKAAERDRQAREDEWQRRRAHRDAEERERMERDREYQEQFQNSKLAEQRLYDFLDRLESDNREKVAYLRQLANENSDGLGQRIMENPDIFGAIEQFIDSDGRGSGAGSAAWTRVVQVLTGSALSAEQMQQVSEKYDRDLAYSFDPDEGY